MLSLSKFFSQQVLFGRPKQVIFWCTKLPSLTICYHHDWCHALMDWDIATSKPPIFMTASPISLELYPLSCHELLHTIQNSCLLCLCVHFQGKRGKGQNLQKLEQAKNMKCQHFPAICCLIYAVFTGRGFLWMQNTMVKSKMSSHPDLLGKQEVPEYSCL